MFEGRPLEGSRNAYECGLRSGSYIQVRIGGKGGAREQDEDSRPLFLCGTKQCGDFDFEEPIAAICGEGTCRLYPLTSADHWKCVLTSPDAFQALRQTKFIAVGLSSVRIRCWNPPKRKGPRQPARGNRWARTSRSDQPAGGDHAESSDAAGPRARAAQTVVSNHRMRV